MRRRRLVVTGVVQGVGFRPHVWRLARQCGVSGWIANTAAGVVIEVEGRGDAVARLTGLVAADLPTAARIDRMHIEEVAPLGSTEFVIAASVEAGDGTGAPRGVIPVDLALCAACRDEIDDPASRRFRYPFTNCTCCGPRYSIIEDLPYDRARTTMASFGLCTACHREHDDPGDRRYHAQPIACPSCGPAIWFDDGTRSIRGTDAALAAAQRVLTRGGIVAVLGVGGYHLLCDATDATAVARLRQRKARPDKPFAVMVNDLATAAALGRLTNTELSALTSSVAPIVLGRARRGEGLADGVRAGSPLVGLMVASTPLHHLLFQPVPGRDTTPPRVVVATSGNLASEPLATDPADTRHRLGAIADAFVHHDRPVAHPIDDSVVRWIGGAMVPLRRARGLAPHAVDLPIEVAETLAVGGELKNTFCVASGRRAVLGPHIGDMGDLATLRAFEAGVAATARALRLTPEVVAVDAHPGYATHGWARRHHGGPVLVQHHHAHAVALALDAGLDLSRPLLTIVFDGTGYAPNDDGGELWGGEVLVADALGARRVAHLAAMPLPGGDAGVRHPCRTAIAYLCQLGIALEDWMPPVAACSPVERTAVERQVASDVGIAWTTSMGRLIDVVASLLGVRHRITYEAQAAIELEALAGSASSRLISAVPLHFTDRADATIGLESVIRGVVDAVEARLPTPIVAAAFWRAVAAMVGEVAQRFGTGRSDEVAVDGDGRVLVGLTGGVFQNALLVDLVRRELAVRGMVALTHRAIPPNDGGLALGQAAIAGVMRERT